MTALEMRDDELGGILAWYSTRHTPPRWLPTVFDGACSRREAARTGPPTITCPTHILPTPVRAPCPDS